MIGAPDPESKSKPMKRLERVAMVLALGMAMFLSACSKTVQWEEEVPLNTGETIVVKRSGTYTFKSAPGNPLEFGYGPEWLSTIEFTYRKRHYSYTGDAGLILLAISPDGEPNLVASAANHDWQWKNSYHCITPYYVQFRPDSIGMHWTWPEQINHWLYGLPTNLIFGLPSLESSGKKFSPDDRAKKNASVTAAFGHYKSIDPKHSSENCPKRK